MQRDFLSRRHLAGSSGPEAGALAAVTATCRMECPRCLPAASSDPASSPCFSSSLNAANPMVTPVHICGSSVSTSRSPAGSICNCMRRRSVASRWRDTSPRLTSVSAMRVRLAGLCASAPHRSAGEAVPFCANSAISTRNSDSVSSVGLKHLFQMRRQIAAQDQRHAADQDFESGAAAAPDARYHAGSPRHGQAATGARSISR